MKRCTTMKAFCMRVGSGGHNNRHAAVVTCSSRNDTAVLLRFFAVFLLLPFFGLLLLTYSVAIYVIIDPQFAVLCCSLCC
jgi:hypothetical protein